MEKPSSLMALLPPPFRVSGIPLHCSHLCTHVHAHPATHAFSIASSCWPKPRLQPYLLLLASHLHYRGQSVRRAGRTCP